MLEDQRALEEAQHFRGLATRFFGPIDTQVEASRVIREMAVSLLILAVILGATGSRFGLAGIVGPGLVAVATVALLLSRHRVAAALLLALTFISFIGSLAVHAILGLWGLLLWVAALFISGRASRATFKLHQSSTVAPVGDAGGGPQHGA